MKKNYTSLYKYSFKLIFTLSLFFFIIYFFQNKLGEQNNILNEIYNNLSSIKYTYLILSILIFIIATLLAVFRIAILAWSHNINISYCQLLKNLYIGYFFNSLLMGATGGDVVRSYYLCKQTNKKTEIITVLFIDRVLGILILGLVTTTVLLFNFSDPKLKVIFNSVITVYFLLVFFAIFVSSKRIMSKLSFITKSFKNTRLYSIGHKFFLILHETKKYKKTIFFAGFITFLFQSLIYISAWIASKSIPGLQEIHLKYFFLFLPIIFTITALPISIGGIGVGEMSYAYLFSIVGISESHSITIALLNRFVLIIMALIGGIIYLMPATEKIDIDEAKDILD